VLTESQKRDVLRFIQSLKSTSFTFRELVRFIDLESEDRRSLKRHLDELDAEGVIHRVRRGQYALPSREALVSGTLACHRDGYGFVAPDDRSIHRQDIFVHIRNMNDAMHGDRVLIRVAKRRKPPRRYGGKTVGRAEERLEGTVVRVLERKFGVLVGRYYAHPRFPYVVPLEDKILHDIQIPFQYSGDAKDGQIVVVGLTTPPGRYQNPAGRIVDILGYPDEPGIEYRIVQHKFGLPVEFSPEALEELSRIPQSVGDEEMAGREDFRGIVAVTIDGENAQDFDDAVSLERIDGGNYLLGVHIADVSYYVRDDSAIDRDAFARGTSVYFPDRSIPMLPRELSSGICSLKPGQDRLVFSALMEVDPHGRVIAVRFVEGVLRSRRRMTYTSVGRILDRKDPDEMRKFEDLVPFFRTMEELCLILNKKRMRGGAVDFDLPEAEIQFDQDGKIISVVAAERNIAHRIIEEFMLLANEVVADRLTASGGPALYRIHEEPDPLKVREFAELALALGHTLESRGGRYTPADFQKFCRRLEGKPEGKFMAYLMLRSFMQARYSEINAGHFGLAKTQYTHFTSPIRRYPDLVVHRLLKESLKGGPSKVWQEEMRARMPEIALHVSSRERTADDAEREIENMIKVKFMADKVGDEFDAIVFSVLRQGFFVELLDPFVEGFVPAATLVDDLYRYRDKTHSFVGERHRRHLKPGSRVRVRLDMADRDSRRLSFSLVEIQS